MNAIVIDGNNVTLESLRAGVAEAVKRAYGAERRYAEALNAVFSFDWFEVEASDTSETAKQVHAEKKALYAELKSAEHSNPSTVWARIRKYGKEARHGAPVAGEGAEGEASETAEAGSRDRDPITRNVEELIALYKFNTRQDSLPAKVTEAQHHICMALMALGVDLNMINA
jgi:hypothetical protein